MRGREGRRGRKGGERKEKCKGEEVREEEVREGDGRGGSPFIKPLVWATTDRREDVLEEDTLKCLCCARPQPLYSSL